jgi:DNA-binding beta-propeller fold protein YncE
MSFRKQESCWASLARLLGVCILVTGCGQGPSHPLSSDAPAAPGTPPIETATRPLQVSENLASSLPASSPATVSTNAAQEHALDPSAGSHVPDAASVEPPAEVYPVGTQVEDSDDEPSVADAPRPADGTEDSREKTVEEVEDVEQERQAAARQNPFGRRLDMPEFPAEMEWLNTKPLKLADLHGKFVILDFWTYCCINCMHVLPELKKLEHAYPNNLVVIGVHSAKFETEKDTENIAAAILRYEIEHPVVNDRAHEFWNMLGVRSWPTIVLIDPEGKFVGARAGEFQFEEIDRVLQAALPYYREEGLLDETPLRFELLAFDQEPTPLKYPGKILADESGGRLFITDSNHNRIVVTSLSGQVQTIIGSGKMGAEDGSFAECSFDHPQGLALHGDTLYVADTENHLLRKVDLVEQQVTTIAGLGFQGRIAWPGLENFENLEQAAAAQRRWVGKPSETALNSPWALWVHDDALYIAMAGPHQIWKMPLDESEIGPFAGNGREDIVDGPHLPAEPYGMGASSFAQPSGLSSDGTWLFVADSEGSSIRAVPFDTSKPVRTVVGTAHLPFGRLFQFGDVDGEGEEVRLQHCLEVVYHDGKLYVADTYNHKIKVVDPDTGTTSTLAGTGESGTSDDPGQFFEPAGLAYAQGTLYVADTNNHLIRTIDLASGAVGTLELAGLEPPQLPREVRQPDFSSAPVREVAAHTLRADGGAITLEAEVQLPPGWKVNALAPQHYWIEATGDTGPARRSELGRREVSPPAHRFTIEVPVDGLGRDELTVSLIYYYCQDDDGLCKVGSVVWKIPVEIAEQGDSSRLSLTHEVPE